MSYTYVDKDMRQNESVWIYALYFDPFQKFENEQNFEVKHFNSIYHHYVSSYSMIENEA